MTFWIILTFIIGYALIVLEHPIRLNKTASALITGVLCWAFYILAGHAHEEVLKELSHHLAATSEILFFLLGAMTIVELMDAHKGFTLITDKIQTRDPKKLIIIIGILSFFLAAVLDTLATAVVMVTLLRKLVHDKEHRRLFAGFVVVAANAGGAWSPIGAPTTTMLWIGKQLSADQVILHTFFPSLVCLVVAILYFIWIFRNEKGETLPEKVATERPQGGNIMFVSGILGLLFVPLFKTITHLPPYMGMMLALGLVWLISEIVHFQKDEEDKKHLSVGYALSKIDSSSILFFLGILLAVACLETIGSLGALAKQMDSTFGNLNIVVTLIGLASAVIDNIPLVAACKGMYSTDVYAMDSSLWHFLAYCAATGGSILIIGSAAGVAVMGMEKIDFMWYVRKISLPAALAYFAGIGAYLLFH